MFVCVCLCVFVCVSVCVGTREQVFENTWIFLKKSFHPKPFNLDANNTYILYYTMFILYIVLNHVYSIRCVSVGDYVCHLLAADVARTF